MKATIRSWQIGRKTFTGETFEESLNNGKATVFIQGRNASTKTFVEFESSDSDVWLVCKAAVKSGIDWKWPWWRRSANRKLAYLKREAQQKNNGQSPQLFLERPLDKTVLDEQMEGM